jgi:transketolase
MQAAAHHKVGSLIVIVDHNKLQSDKLVSEIVSIGDLERKFAAFGWHVARCQGHDFRALTRIFAEFAAIPDQPKILIADTIKGRGVSFMEHPFALEYNNGLYPWHAGAPDDEAFTAAHREIMLRLNERLRDLGIEPLVTEDITPEKKAPSGVTPEYVVKVYGQRLTELAATRKDLVVLDADLAADNAVRGFEQKYPARFIENGIAEQDMVSTACGLASQGLLPVVNSFASFLASRANEQIYNSATEHRKIIYGCNFAGLIPAGPGKSHQSIRDISLFGALPDVTILEPGCGVEARMIVDYAVNESPESVMIRLIIGPSPRDLQLPAGYQLTFGRGVTLRAGTDAVLFAYGPVMLHEALLASELLEPQGFGLKIVNMPWLNRVDAAWLAEVIGGCPIVAVLDDHAPVGGLGDYLLNALTQAGLINGRTFAKFAVEGYPACGTPAEALAYHRLDGASLAARVRELKA